MPGIDTFVLLLMLILIVLTCLMCSLINKKASQIWHLEILNDVNHAQGSVWYVYGTTPVSNPTDTERDQSVLAKICFYIELNCYIYIQNAIRSQNACDNLKTAFEGRR